MQHDRMLLAGAAILLSTGVVAGVPTNATAAASGAMSTAEQLRLAFTGISVIASGLLVVLYFQQKEIAETEHEADVELEGYAATKNDLDLCLTNVGRGPATNLSIDFNAEVPDGPSRFCPRSKELIKSLHDGVENEWIRPNRNYLSGGATYTRFRTSVQLYDKVAERKVTPAYLSNNDGPERLRLRGVLHYEDRLGNNNEEKVVDLVLPIGEERTLEEMLPDGLKNDRYQQRVVEGDSPFGPGVTQREYLR